MKDSRKTKKQLIAELDEIRKERDELLRRGAEPVPYPVAARGKNDTFEELLNAMNNGVAIYESHDGETFLIRDMNRAGERISGVNRDDVVGRSVREVFPGVAEFGLVDVLKKVWRSGDPERLPVSQYRDERISHWSENYVFRLPSGEVVAVYDDATERKRAQKELKESEERYRILFENVPVGLYRSTPEGRLLDANQAMADLLGYPSKEALLECEISTSGYLNPNDRLVWLAEMEQRGFIRSFEVEWQCYDGRPVWVRENAQTIRAKDGSILYFEGTVEDITEQRRAREELRRQKEFLEDVIESFTHPFYVIDANDYTVVMANSAALKGETLSPGMTCYELAYGVHKPCDGPDRRCAVEEVKKTRKLCRVEQAHRDAGKVSYSDVFAFPVFDSNGDVAQVIEYWVDTTERREAEIALLESEDRFQRFAAQIGDVIYRYDMKNDRYDFMSPSFERLSGYPMKAILSDPARFYRNTIVHPDDRQRVIRELFDRVRKGPDAESLTSEYRAVLADGTVVWASERRDFEFTSDGELYRINGIIRNVTERKEVEEELRKLAAIPTYSSELINMATLDGRMVFLNEAGARMLGIDPSTIREHAIFEVIPEHLLVKVKDVVIPEMLEKGSWEGELQYRNIKTDKLTDVHAVTFTIKDSETGEPHYLANISRDITDRKRAEKLVFESEEKYRTLTENLNVGVFRNTPGPKGEFIEANSAIIQMFGYESRGEFLQTHVADLYENPDERLPFTERISSEGHVRNKELTLKRKDGSTFVGAVSAVAVKDSHGNVKYYDGIIEDITERKIVEEAIRDSEERYRDLVEKAGIAIVTEDPEGDFIYFNDQFAELFGYTPNELKQLTNKDITYPADLDLVLSHHKARIQGQEPADRYEFRGLRKDKMPVHLEVHATELRRGDKIIGTRSYVWDISKRKLAQEEREKLISELQEALARIRTLSGLLPICANCKRIRDDKGYWSQVEVYIKDHAEVEFSHGICPECMAKLYPEYVEEEPKDA